jgi:RNA polymerase sigma-70 factor (ECF subfamily)
MLDENAFRDLLCRVRAGEQQAAADLVRLYEPEVRRMVRLRLTSPALRRLLDSLDICQSVLAKFFVRAAAGQFDLETPEQLLNLLATMVRNKVGDEVRKQRAARRVDRHIAAGATAALDEAVAPGAGPSETAATKELIRLVWEHLSADEQFLADQWSLGRSWEDIAVEMGDTPEALRKRLTRGLDRVARRLKLSGPKSE